ncbi:hypothetical protein JD844_006148 [Phrynosoma platyrhinos]|uniref:Glutamate receptor n=1 Tax=Phrynosoma platyrhinos TaxID=52577 RepID=A0ABQ7TQG5_PHRPL|nr:hypothetical protein JD844_006148 [Phrynosoma platyrhinos]
MLLKCRCASMLPSFLPLLWHRLGFTTCPVVAERKININAQGERRAVRCEDGTDTAAAAAAAAADSAQSRTSAKAVGTAGGRMAPSLPPQCQCWMGSMGFGKVGPSGCKGSLWLQGASAILDDQTVCGRGERLALALAREHINSIIEVPAKARVEVEIFELQRDSQYETTDTMCQILPKGVVSVLGPASSPASASIVSHICGEKEIPHVKVGPEETPKLQYLRFASVSLYPSNEDVSLAVSRILKSFNYPSASLICAKAECEEGGSGIGAGVGTWGRREPGLLRLEELVRQFLISKETLSIRMLDDTNDPTPLLKEIRDDKISTIIVDANASISYLILKKASELGMTSAFYKYILTTMDFPILHLDGVVDDHSNVLGFSMFNTSHPFYTEFVRSLNMSWRENCELSPYPGPAVEYDGLTGRVEFNSKGQRTNYTLRILEKARHGHREIGVWYSNRTLAMNATTLDINVSESLVNKTLIITTILENPYVMRRANFQELSGTEQYEGFCVDMLHELADILKFRFQIKLVDDGLYGAPEPNGSWTGMVGELINRKADLAVAAFTITAEREKVIDFSKPFMTLGISILYRVHMGRKPGYFSFLDPFSPAVWLFMLLAYLAVSCVLFLAARWAFTLIIISSYTANLAAFLTVQRMENSRYQTYQRMWNYMHSKQPSVFVKSTEEGIARVLNSKYAFLLESTMNEYHRRLNCNLTQIGGLLDTKGYGIGMPLGLQPSGQQDRGPVAARCRGSHFLPFWPPPGSPFRDEITLAILQLQENNRLEILKRKWWEGSKCPKEEDHRAKGLGMENIGGIFVVLICGLIIAVFVAVMEFVWATRRSAEHEEISVCQEMLRELRHAVSCRKPTRSRRRHRRHFAARGALSLRSVREMRLSNGKLYSGTLVSEPGPQRLLEEPPRPCTHVRICHECRRIQTLRGAPLPPRGPPPPEEGTPRRGVARELSEQE